MPKINKINLIIILIFIVFFAIKIPQIDFRYGDENIYFQMGNLITQGQLPYQDFFLASPPLQILLIALIIFIFGFNIYLLKIIPLLCIAGSAFFIYKILACQKQKIAGILSVILYLFSFLILTTSDYFSGAHLTIFLCLFSIYLLLKNKPAWSGLLSALALLARFYAAPIILAIIIFILLNKNKRKHFWKFILSSGSIFIGINLILYLIFKENYIQDVFIYNLLKTEVQSKMSVFKFFLEWDWPLLILASLSLLINKFKKLILPLLGVLTTGLFLFIFQDIYYLYFNLLMPFIAILAGLFLARIVVTSLNYQKYFIHFVSGGIILALLMLSLTNINFYLKDHAGTARIDYIENLNNFIINNSNSQDKIYGSFEITPLVSVMTGREIVGNFVDTNSKTISTGMFDINEREKILKNNKIKFIITKILVSPDGNILALDNFISFNFLENNCQPVKTFPIKKDYYSNLLIVWECGF